MVAGEHEADEQQVQRVGALFEHPDWAPLLQRGPRSGGASGSGARAKVGLIALGALGLGVLSFPYGWFCFALPPLVAGMMIWGLRGELAQEARARSEPIELWPVAVLDARTELNAGGGQSARRVLDLLCADGRRVTRTGEQAVLEGARVGVLGAAYCRGEDILEFVAMEAVDARNAP